jgi:hypothetical protein
MEIVEQGISRRFKDMPDDVLAKAGWQRLASSSRSAVLLSRSLRH